MKNTIAKLISVASGAALVTIFALGALFSAPTVRAANTSCYDNRCVPAYDSCLSSSGCAPGSPMAGAAYDSCVQACKNNQTSCQTLCDKDPAGSAAAATTAAVTGSTTGGTSGPVAIINPLGTTDPREFIGRIIRALMSVIGSLTLLMFIYGGVTWMTSMGDDKKVKKGKDIITYAILGLFVIAVAYVAVNAVIKGLSTGSAI